jgi:hypothetical protein
MRLLPHASLRRALLVAATFCILLLLLALTVQAHTAADSVASATVPADDTVAPAVPPADSPSLSSAASAPLPEFVATNEWQSVLPGQSVPAGLWMRVDMTTGQRMARLLPEEERNDYAKRRDAEQQLVIVSEEDAAAPSTSPSSASTSDSGVGGPSLRELAAPGSEQSSPSSTVESALHDAALLSARRARLAALRETFFLKEEVEQMKSLLAICIEPTATVSDVVAALSGLEEFVHQVDNANDFAVIGGFDVALTLAQQRIEQEVKDAAATPVEAPTATAAAAAAITDDAATISLDAIVEATLPVTPTIDLPSTEGLNAIDAANITGVAGQEVDSTAAGDDGPPAPPAPPAPLAVQAARLYELQMHAAWVIGTAAQNNRRVQDEANKQKAIQVLTELLRDTLADEQAATAADDGASDVRSSGFELRLLRLQLLGKLLYALSSLMRHHANNQATFFAAHGADVLRFTLPPENWPRCSETADSVAEAANGATADSAYASPARLCLTSAESARLQRARSSVQLKALALVQDIIIDHTLNAASSTDSATAAATAAADAAAAAAEAPSAQPHVSRASLSDPSLYAALTSDEWCTHLLSSLGAVGGLPLSLASATSTSAVSSLHALLKADQSACRSVLAGAVGQRFQPALRAFAQLHEAEAVRLQQAAAATAAEGGGADGDGADDMAHHRALSEAAAAILRAGAA